MRNPVPVLVLGSAAFLVVAALVNFAFGEGPGLAYLVPDPDTIVWREGDERLLWVETNRDPATLTVSTSSLAFAEVHRLHPESGELVVTGRIGGCSAPVDSQGGRSLPVHPNTLIVVIACSASSDVGLRLLDEEGGELWVYEVDILAAAPTPAARPLYVSRRVCPNNRATKSLDTGDNIGETFSNVHFGLAQGIDAAVVEDVAPTNNYRYFLTHSVTAGNLQLAVSEMGASDSPLGFDDGTVYPVRLVATATDGATSSLDVGIWLDSSATSSGSGICPP